MGAPIIASHANPLLARFRTWVEGETLSDPHWSAEWLEAMADANVESDAATVLDVLYETPYRRRERAEQEEHARRVIGRALRLAQLAWEDDEFGETGAYGIKRVAHESAGALVCGACGRAWVEDITPAGRCPWEDLHGETDES